MDGRGIGDSLLMVEGGRYFSAGLDQVIKILYEWAGGGVRTETPGVVVYPLENRYNWCCQLLQAV